MIDINKILEKIVLSDYNSSRLPYSIIPLFFERISTRELLHSEIIASLINPQESHGSEFLLRGFLKMIELKDEQYEELGDVCIQLEKGIEGQRRIDMLITWGKNAVIIENKLNNAVDQYDQLRDYYRAISKKYSVVKVVYMPLNPNKAACHTDIDSADKDLVKNIYPKDLITWLVDGWSELENNDLKLNAMAYANLLRYINEQYKNQMIAEKLQQNLNLTPEKLTKLIDIAQIINSPVWNEVRLKTISELVSKELNDVLVKNGSPKKHALQLHLEGFKYWVEVWAYPYEYRLWIASKDDNHPEGFEFKEESNGYKYFKNSEKFTYEYPTKDDSSVLISDIIELLKQSIIK